ncbi:MAG: NAD(P)H-dependent glycerol-3-phosphate dehydrogenase [Candidatus Methylumidiphilus sp.]
MSMAVAVFGAGSWGTALALLIARNGHAVTLWGRDPAHIEALARDRCNQRYLPGFPFPDNLSVTADLAAAAQSCALALVAVPSHAFRELLPQLRGHLSAPQKIAWATKGLESRSGRLLHEVVAEGLGAATPAAVLSGPTFAGEVAAGQPTAITVASANPAFAQEVAGLLHSLNFRAYTTDDMIGVQLGGATKNVLAIAAGMAEGLGFGANARAALVTRGLAEMMRLGMAMGGRPETLMGLAGVGDLILTCTDNQSRNRRFGLGLGRGQPREEVAAAIGQEIEGVATAGIIHRLAQSHGIDMPITEQVCLILHAGLAPAEAVRNLLLREPKPESALPC